MPIPTQAASAASIWITDLISYILVIAFVLIIVAAILFVILVTYLKQWDIYYPRLDKWLKTRAIERREKERKEKKRAGKLARKEKDA